MPSVQDEYLDVVDEHDEIVGSEKRGIIHARKLRHRAVHILVFNDAGQLFLQRRAKTKDTFPDRWDSSCSGHVDSGEDYLESALRELGEELGLHGLSPDFLQPLFKINSRLETGLEFVWVYRARHNGPFVLHPTEISGGNFFAPEDIDRIIASQPEQFAPAFTYLWQHYRTASASGLEP